MYRHPKSYLCFLHHFLPSSLSPYSLALFEPSLTVACTVAARADCVGWGFLDGFWPSTSICSGVLRPGSIGFQYKFNLFYTLESRICCTSGHVQEVQVYVSGTIPWYVPLKSPRSPYDLMQFLEYSALHIS